MSEFAIAGRMPLQGHCDSIETAQGVVEEAGLPSAEGGRSERRTVLVGEAWHGARLDRVLAASIPEFSRRHLQHMIESGLVCVDGLAQTKSARRMRASEVLDVRLQASPGVTAFVPEDIALDIVFEDEHLLVINKPAGLVVHPAAGNWSGTLLNGLLHYFAQNACTEALGLPRAGMIHRLDKDTSGAIVVAKTQVAMTDLVRQLKRRSISRQYLALVATRARRSPWARGSASGVFPGEMFPLRIASRAAIGRDPHNRLRMAPIGSEAHRAGEVGQGGKSAQTDFLRLGMNSGYALLACKLYSGRTHQIRVHLCDLGFPIVADALYGGSAQLGMRRQALHARRLSFTHPVSGREVVFIAQLPADLLHAAQGVVGPDELQRLIEHSREII